MLATRPTTPARPTAAIRTIAAAMAVDAVGEVAVDLGEVAEVAAAATTAAAAAVVSEAAVVVVVAVDMAVEALAAVVVSEAAGAVEPVEDSATKYSRTTRSSSRACRQMPPRRILPSSSGLSVSSRSTRRPAKDESLSTRTGIPACQRERLPSPTTTPMLPRALSNGLMGKISMGRRSK